MIFNSVKIKWIILAIILIIYAVLIFNNFLTRPFLWLDEGFKMQLARNFADFGTIGMQFSPGEVVGSLHNASTGWVLPVIMGSFFKVFGTSFFMGRFVAALFLLGFITISYLLFSKLWGVKTAVLSTLLLVTFSPLYVNGKMVLAEIPSLFFLVSGIYAYFYFKPGTYWNISLSALLFGLFASGKLSFLVFFGLSTGLVHLALLLIKKVRLKELVLFWIIFVLTVLPTIILIINPILSPSDTVTLSTANYTNVFGESCLWCNVRDNSKSFFTNSTLAHLAGILFFVILAPIFYIKDGLGLNKNSWLLWALGFYGFLTLLHFLQSPGVFRYLLPLQIISLSLFVPATSYLFERFGKNSIYYSIYYLLIVTLILVQGIHFARFSSIYEREGPVLFEQYVNENIKESDSVGLINSSLGPVVVPNTNMTQFFRFLETGIVEGTNPLESGILPDYLIYRDYGNYELDVAPYEEKIKENYILEGDFDGIIVMKLLSPTPGVGERSR
jgi:hypothetical protein